MNMADKKKMSLTTQILIATIGGIIFGSLIGDKAAQLKFIGDIFIRLIQMSVVLLVMTSVMGAIGNVDAKGAGKMGFHTFKWIIIFTVFSTLLGLALGAIVKPGADIDLSLAGEVAQTDATAASIQDTLLGFVPTNIISSMASGSMVPCILFSIFFGLAMGTYKRQTGNTIVGDVINAFNAVIMNIIKMVMTLAPIGIFCLLANVAGAIGFKVIIPMLKFLGCLLVGDLIQFAVYMPLTAALCKVDIKKMPQKFAKMSMMALTTTSSAICLPTQMEDSVTKFGISKKVTDFVAPITMSMNSTGAAMCYVLAIMFMSQSTGIVLSAGQLALSIVLAILMCMGTIVVPGGMVVTYTFFAASLGLPMESIAILIGIDWFSGMFRTVLNVDADVLVSFLVASKMGELDKDVYDGKKTVDYVA